MKGTFREFLQRFYENEGLDQCIAYVKGEEGTERQRDMAIKAISLQISKDEDSFAEWINVCDWGLAQKLEEVIVKSCERTEVVADIREFSDTVAETLDDEIVSWYLGDETDD